jgi:hypothetical protein
MDELLGLPIIGTAETVRWWAGIKTDFVPVLVSGLNDSPETGGQREENPVGLLFGWPLSRSATAWPARLGEAFERAVAQQRKPSDELSAFVIAPLGQPFTAVQTLGERAPDNAPQNMVLNRALRPGENFCQCGQCPHCRGWDVWEPGSGPADSQRQTIRDKPLGTQFPLGRMVRVRVWRLEKGGNPADPNASWFQEWVQIFVPN